MEENKAFKMHTPEDRALSEHNGSQILIKKENGKYSMFLPTTGTGENGSAPAQLTKTVLGNKQASSVAGRKDNPQKTLPFYTHRDNLTILEKAKGLPHDFLRLLPDFTGVKYSGEIDYKWNDTGTDALEQGEVTITPTTEDEYVPNCYDIVEDTAIIKNAIPETLVIKKTGKQVINIETEPVEATISAVSDTQGVATVQVSGKAVTITGVAKGSAIITITCKATGYASFDRTILVIDID